MRRQGRGRCKPLSGWLVAAHLWRRSMEYGLRLIALVAGGLLATIDSTDPSVGWLDFGAAFGGLLLTAIVCWKLANGMQRAPQAGRIRRRSAIEEIVW